MPLGFLNPIFPQLHLLYRSLIQKGLVHGRLLKKLMVLFILTAIVGHVYFQHVGLDSPSSSQFF